MSYKLTGMPPLATVHPLQPRFAQAITGALCLEAVLFRTWPVVAVALGLVLAGLLVPRLSPVNMLFRLIAPAPGALEPVAPVRFAQGMAGVMLGAAFALLLTGFDVAGWTLVTLVAVVALFSAITGICVGCELYRILLSTRRASDDADLRGMLGLGGSGPWLVVLTAPGCGRCEPVARELERTAEGREVVRVNLAERPAAAALPVRSVPAALAVGADGRLLTARAGRLGADDLAAVISAA